MKPEGLSYEDDYRGNAVAGMFVEGRAEIRFHSAFPEKPIHNLWNQLLAAPDCAGLSTGRPTYQNRAI